MNVTIGIDNGQSGSVAILGPLPAVFAPVPTFECLHHSRSKGGVTRRLHRAKLSQIIRDYQKSVPCSDHAPAVRVYLERPYTGKFLNATLPAHRFFESTLCLLDDMDLGYEVIDSRDWQSVELPAIRGTPELKKASRLRGCQLYPHLRDAVTKHGDADSLLIAHRYHHHT